MNKLKVFPDTQAALLLTRRCSGFAKLAFSARTVPPDLQREPLAEFTEDLRAALEGILGEELPDRSWHLAKLGIEQGDLGFRDASQHAPAAYFASVLSSTELCQTIDSAFDSSDSSGCLNLSQVEAELRSKILHSADLNTTCKSQKQLSTLIDAASKEDLLQSNKGDVPFCAHVALCGLPTAGAC